MGEPEYTYPHNQQRHFHFEFRRDSGLSETSRNVGNSHINVRVCTTFGLVAIPPSRAYQSLRDIADNGTDRQELQVASAYHIHGKRMFPNPVADHSFHTLPSLHSSVCVPCWLLRRRKHFS
jgi:hypothetical protein